jgi:hypothetical protein
LETPEQKKLLVLVTVLSVIASAFTFVDLAAIRIYQTSFKSSKTNIVEFIHEITNTVLRTYEGTYNDAMRNPVTRI